jgi:FkbM family methyltransferase
MVNRYEMRAWLKDRVHRLGYDVVRYRTARSLAGHTEAVLKGLAINGVLDVGANIGQYGTLLRSIGYRGRIVSFEPVADVYELLRSRAVGDANWLTVNTALGSAKGSATINVTRGSDLSSMRNPIDTDGRSLNGAIRVERAETIAISRLDEVVDEYVDRSPSRRLLLKCDTQGWDLEVLKGATGCLDDVVAVQVEMSVIPLYDGMPGWLESLTYLHDLGFEPTGFFPVTYLADARVVEFDCLMVRSSQAETLGSLVQSRRSA